MYIPQENETIGKRFVVKSLLGQGVSGYVFSAYDKVNNKTVAIKLLDPREVNSVAMSRAKEETKLNLQCDFIASSIGGFAEKNNTYLIMEYVDGKPLSEIASVKPMPINAAIYVGVCLCEAIKYLLSRRLVSTDIKPENIMVENSTGRCRLIDLTMFEYLNQKPPVVSRGTLPFSPRELLLKQPLHNTSDVYSTCVVLYQLITGSQPLANIPDDEAEKLIVSGYCPDMAPIASKNRIIADLIKAGFSPDPNKRPDADSFQKGLESVVPKAKTIRLNYFNKHHILRTIEITSDEYFLGRFMDLSNDYLSELHAIIKVSGDTVTIIDNNSRNGVYVNSQRVQAKEIHNGDEVKLADMRILVWIS